MFFNHCGGNRVTAIFSNILIMTLLRPGRIPFNYLIETPSTLHRRNLKTHLLFPLLGLPSTLIRKRNGTFRKRSSNRKNLKTLALRFSVGGTRFENAAF